MHARIDSPALTVPGALQALQGIGNAVKQLWQYGLGQGGPDQDFTELIKHLEKWVGVTVGGGTPTG